ncbi:hypothetical protein BLNAU_10003 [Blattamonas nauphoetae]|uniref:Uncharacterized protein n=1 Tax=Blattamonas nauphoetae TaxID=2049346 RepID=A0ABQ9XUB2_9EUKA|nr:hypothetical protein BLNAU_10003 [Blattamonas nauphoetae]
MLLRKKWFRDIVHRFRIVQKKRLCRFFLRFEHFWNQIWMNYQHVVRLRNPVVFSVGLRSIASSLLALIQNTLGSRELQKTEHCHLPNHQQETMMTTPVNDGNKQLLELHSTVCNMAKLMAEQFGRIDSRMMKYDSILNRLDEKQQLKTLQQTRFQRWSKTGADAVEIFDEDFIIKTGNTFTRRQRPENEKTNFIPKTLFSPLISSDVAQLSFSITHSNNGLFYGAVSAHLVDMGTKTGIWAEELCRGAWGHEYKPSAVLQANGAPPRRYTQQIVLEADCRIGRRTLKVLEDGEVNPTIYVNLSLPFRFVIILLHPDVSITIKSLTFTAKPTLKGGGKAINFQS